MTLSEITQRLVDPVHGGYVEAVHIDDVRLLLNESESMKAAIKTFCEEQRGRACAEWRNQDHIAPLFKIAANY